LNENQDTPACSMTMHLHDLLNSIPKPIKKLDIILEHMLLTRKYN